MKTSFLTFALLTVVAGGANAAIVDSVTASQSWPWSTDIKVKYVLSNVTEPTDLTVTAMNGGAALAVPVRAIKGDLHGITSDSEGGSVEGEFTIDPVAAFDAAQVALTDLKIKVSATSSPANINEALYRIYDLVDGSCTDVTRKDLLNGKWGAVETDYKAIDPNFKTDAEDVLIWTGVTNDIAYKTTKLVMRKVHAKDVVWQAGDPAGALKVNSPLQTQYWAKLTYDYYIAVFETTVAQYTRIMSSTPATVTSVNTAAKNKIGQHACYGHPKDGGSKLTVINKEYPIFPQNTYVRDVGGQSVSSAMWTRTGCEFTLPTRAEWTFACQGGCGDKVLYSGEDQAQANVAKIAWCGRSDWTGEAAHPVGELKPNAYGLYDMLGNVLERTLSSGAFNLGMMSGTGESKDDPLVNPLGKTDTTADSNPSLMGGGSFYAASNGSWQDCRAVPSVGWYEWYNEGIPTGFRLVCPVTKKWGADWPNTILEE